ncbi:MAG TPA: di-heme oxidoredictase family protein [Verrucomicrobiae bacterium]|nr:di-heme oxidoredictase family protein [Verrucomicrobiae bacterium]
MRTEKRNIAGSTLLLLFCISLALPLWSQQATPTAASSAATDPGPRAGGVNAGTPLSTLSAAQLQFFQDGQNRFQEVDQVANGLGPTYNSNSCASCHAQPSVGGSSPSTTAYPNIGANPQMEAANASGATNSIPYFITATGPVREARFPFVVTNGQVTRTADGEVHALYTIAGRSDASGCSLAQPNFTEMRELNNIIFRIPTPTYGAGLIEAITDETILANMQANASLKQSLGISGHPNYSGNDGSMTRFGWKAQNKSLDIFSGEAYNVEIGVTNELFPNERGNPPASCLLNPTPEDATNFTGSGPQISSDVVEFSNFMRFLAPPTPSTTGISGNPSATSIQQGQAIFSQIHCNMCHTSSLTTGKSAYTSGLSNQTAALFSDLLVHNMGSGLADNVSQGTAAGDEFRTAPLWGLGQRVFFLHDGRSGPSNGGLVNAIEQHSSSGSEANRVIASYNQLTPQQQQALLNFLRSL